MNIRSLLQPVLSVTEKTLSDYHSTLEIVPKKKKLCVRQVNVIRAFIVGKQRIAAGNDAPCKHFKKFWL